MPVRSAGRVPYTTQFTFADDSLQSYKRRAETRLDFILEQLDLGSAANLGYTKVTWLPDNIARIRYVAMEGVLEPIIVVRIEFQEGFTAGRDEVEFQEQLEEILEEIPDEPEEPSYIPFAWIGIRATNHTLVGGNEGNPNCPFWGYPIDPYLVGFEPDPLLTGLDFTHTCEAQPGLLNVGGTWASRVGHRASEQLFLRVNGGQTWTLNQFGLDQGTFQDSDWNLSTQGLLQSSHNGMFCAEHLDALVTEPDAADGFNAKRSIIIAPGGVRFPGFGDQPADVSATIQVGGGVTAAMKATYNGGLVTAITSPGRYEIGAFARSFDCECTQAQVEIRVVLGAVGGGITVTDFIAAGIGNPPVQNRMVYDREVTLGGNPPCFGDPDNATGPNDGGVGWWNQSLFIDVENGSVSTGTATRRSPFFGSECGPSNKFGPSAGECIAGCSGETTVQPANNLDYPLGVVHLTVDTPAGQKVVDLRQGVIWHLARVAQVRVENGKICRVRLVGNDGGQGDCGDCKPFSYGHNLRAIGIDPDIELGTDLRTLEDQGQVPYSVGELVVVVGFTDSPPACGILPGDWRLIVTRTTGGHGENFTNQFWSDLRCGKAGPVEKFFGEVEDLFRDRSACDGPKLAVKCTCSSGQMRCFE